jgi:hypothetical protein
MATIAEILNEFLDRINQPREASYVGASTPAARQYVSLFKFIGDELLDYQNGWPQLKRIHKFKSYQGIANYQLPGDFLRPLTGTQWDATNQIPLAGPLSNERLAFQTYGVNIATPFAGFQLNGAQGYKITTSPYTQYSAGYFQISPPGQDSEIESVIQYVSSNYVWAQNWIANTAYVSGNIRTIHDEMWICTTSGTTATTGQYPVYGWDNNVYWEPILTYVVSELYHVGQLVFANSKVYEVTTGGKSSAGSPSVTSGSETLGTVVFQYVATPSTWVAGTTYATDDYVVTPTGVLPYKCLMGGVSGLLEPKFWISLITSIQAPPLFMKKCNDGTAVWTLYREPYAPTADTDFVLLDSSLFIEGLRWAWYQSKKQDYEALKKKWEGNVKVALGRHNGQCIISAAGDVNGNLQWPMVGQTWGGPLPG